MSLLKIASVPAATVSPQSAVTEAVQLMHDKRVGAVAVIDNDALVGIFTERDVMIRVVLAGKVSKTTTMSDVMTREVETALADMPLWRLFAPHGGATFPASAGHRFRQPRPRDAIRSGSAPARGRRSEYTARFDGEVF